VLQIFWLTRRHDAAEDEAPIRRGGYAFAERGAGGGSSVDAKRSGTCMPRPPQPRARHRKAVRTQKLRKHLDPGPRPWIGMLRR
jgi:hypothetical protein